MTLGTSLRRINVGQYKSALGLKIYRKNWLARLVRTTAEPRMMPEKADKLEPALVGVADGASSVPVVEASVCVAGPPDPVPDPVPVGEVAAVLVGREMVTPLSRQVAE